MNFDPLNTAPELQGGVIECPEFDLDLTLNSGQVFHWIPAFEGFEGCIGETPCFIRQKENLLYYQGGNAVLIRNYFALDHNLSLIRDSCANHPASYDAAKACRGLRIMRQPRWECLATFILSPMKQVAHIRQMSLALRMGYGRKLSGSSVPAFPEASVLASVTERDLRQCGLGFRAGALRETSRRISSGDFDLENLSSMNTEDARKALCSLPGIGRKVANCILLFAYERLDVVPVDVWISRVLVSFRSRKAKSAEELERYGQRLLGPYAGYIQQYLFHRARTEKLKYPRKLKSIGSRPSYSKTAKASPRRILKTK